MCAHVSRICLRYRALSSVCPTASGTATPTSPRSTTTRPIRRRRSSRPAYRMADGPMSTPRRPAPRSSPAPMIATGASVCGPGTAARLTPEPMEHRRTAIRVALADDDELYVRSLAELIERQPELTVVGTAKDGVEAIDLADRVMPDAVVIDLHMPRLDGVSALARLRRDYPALCLIALTGDPSQGLQRAAREAGADAVLHKGEMLEGLVDRLTQVPTHAVGG